MPVLVSMTGRSGRHDRAHEVTAFVRESVMREGADATTAPRPLQETVILTGPSLSGPTWTTAGLSISAT